MATMIIRAKRFSLKGFWYYQKHKKWFTNRSFAKLLTTITKGFKFNISSAISAILSDGVVWVERNETKLKVRPESELKEGDKVVFWMFLGNTIYQVQNNRLVLEEW